MKVLGEAYAPDDDEDMATATVSTVSIPQGRRRTEVTRATAGNWVFIDGIDGAISDTATVSGVQPSERPFSSGHLDDDVQIFSPLKFPQVSLKSDNNLWATLCETHPKQANI